MYTECLVVPVGLNCMTFCRVSLFNVTSSVKVQELMRGQQSVTVIYNHLLPIQLV